MNTSKIKAKKSIPWGQIIVIRELVANPQAVSQLEQNMKATQPSLKPEEIQQQVYELVLRDNYYNRVMDLLSQSYQIEFSQEDLKLRSANLKKLHADMTPETAQQVAKLNTIRELIYLDLAKELSISVSDEQVKQTLENYYQTTGQPIREYLANRKRFEEVKQTLLDQIIADRILNAFKPDFQLDEFNKRMAEQASKQQQPAPKPAPSGPVPKKI